MIFMKSNKGFTLVELIVVIAILALLSSLAVSAFSGIMNQARDAQRIHAANAIASALNNFNTLAVSDAHRIIAIPAVGAQFTSDGQNVGASGPSATPTHLSGANATGFMPMGFGWNMDLVTYNFVREAAGGRPYVRWNHADAPNMWSVHRP